MKRGDRNSSFPRVYIARRRVLLLVLALISVVFLFNVQYVQTSPSTNVSGIIEANTTWTLANSPYIITGNILVKNGVNLTIEPGVVVKFDGYYSIEIKGGLIAVGTSEKKITFTSNQLNSQPGDWRAILFKDSSLGLIVNGNYEYVSGSIIKHCEISYGGPIQLYGGAAYISDNYIHHVTGSPPVDWPNGVIWIGAANVVVKNNIIVNNEISGVCDSDRGSNNPVILNNTIKNNKAGWGGGIALFAYGGLIKDNIIVNNTAYEMGGGIAAYRGNYIIEGNLISNNHGPSYESDRGGSAIGTWSHSLTIRNNSIVGNNDFTAVGFFSSWSTLNELTLEQNDIADNPSTYDLYIKEEAGGMLNTSNNYWGTTDTNSIIQRISGYYDAYGSPRVTITPLVPSPNPLFLRTLTIHTNGVSSSEPVTIAKNGIYVGTIYDNSPLNIVAYIYCPYTISCNDTRVWSLDSDTRYKFVNWTGAAANSTSNPVTVILTKNSWVTIYYKTQYLTSFSFRNPSQ